MTLEKNIEQEEEVKTARALLPKKKIIQNPQIINELMGIYACFDSVTPSLCTHSFLYFKFHELLKKKARGYLPYFSNSKVLHLDPLYQIDFSSIMLDLGNNRKISTVDCMFQIAAHTYIKNSDFPLNCNPKLALELYFLLTSVCVMMTADGKIRLLTKNNFIVNSNLPLQDINCKEIAKKVNLRLDNLQKGKITAMELKMGVGGFIVEPTEVELGHKYCTVIPKFFLDAFISRIYATTDYDNCKITYIEKDGSEHTFISAKTKPKTGDIYERIALGYLNYSNNRYGMLRFVEYKTNRIICFPVTHLVGINY